MPRPSKPNPALHSAVSTAVADLVTSVSRLVAAVESSVVGRGVTVGTSALGKFDDAAEKAKQKSARLKKALKAYWSKMKGKAREARIAKMLDARGVKRRKQA